MLLQRRIREPDDAHFSVAEDELLVWGKSIRLRTGLPNVKGANTELEAIPSAPIAPLAKTVSTLNLSFNSFSKCNDWCTTSSFFGFLPTLRSRALFTAAVKSEPSANVNVRACFSKASFNSFLCASCAAGDDALNSQEAKRTPIVRDILLLPLNFLSSDSIASTSLKISPVLAENRVPAPPNRTAQGAPSRDAIWRLKKTASPFFLEADRPSSRQDAILCMFPMLHKHAL